MNSESSRSRQCVIRIEVEGDPTKTYHPGDKVVGNVVFEPPFDQRVSSASVELSGTCDTKSPLMPGFCERYFNTTNHICLFRIEQHLTVNDQKTWPFEIEFPQWTDPDERVLPPNVYNLASGALPLPPSFRITKSQDYAVGEVQYSVSAVVISELGEGRSPFRHRADALKLGVDLVKAQPDEFLAPRATFNAKTIARRSFDWRFESPSSARKLMRSCTLGWLKPRLKIQPRFEFPPAFVLGEDSSVTLTLDSNSKTTDLAAIPGQKLEDVKIVLESHTDIAAYKMGWRQSIHTHQTVHKRSMAMPILRGMVCLTVNIPESSTPDFVTYTLIHTHKLKITGFVRVGRKRFPLVFTGPIKIVTMPDHPYPCPTHSMSYSTSFLPSWANTPCDNITTGATTPDSNCSFCLTCRAEEARKAAKLIMDPIREVSITDVRSLAISPEREISNDNESRASQEDDQQRGSGEKVAPQNEKRDSADSDRLCPASERRDSAYVSALVIEETKEKDGSHVEAEEEAVDKGKLPLNEKTGTKDDSNGSNDTQIRTSMTAARRYASGE